MRDWLLIGGGLLIIAVLAHGAWVHWRQRNGVGRYQHDVPDMDGDDLDLLRAELPGGGARVVGRVDDDAVPARGPLVASGPGGRRRQPSPGREPIVAAVRARRPAAPAAEEEGDRRVSPVADAAAQPLVETPVTDEPAVDPRPARTPVPSSESAPGIADEPEPGVAADAPLRAGRDADPDADLAAVEDEAPLVAEPRPGRRSGRAPATRRSAPAPQPQQPTPAAEADDDSGDDSLDFEDVLIINVLCREGRRMDGPTLIEVVSDHGMQYGDMNIFHRPDRRGRAAFSMASAVKPGTFDLADIDDFTTPGVSFFMRLPGPAEPLEAFEQMVRVAADLAETLGAELKDEHHSVMTPQTLEHCRQRIREFVRRQMMHGRN